MFKIILKNNPTYLNVRIFLFCFCNRKPTLFFETAYPAYKKER